MTSPTLSTVAILKVARLSRRAQRVCSVSAVSPIDVCYLHSSVCTTCIHFHTHLCKKDLLDLLVSGIVLSKCLRGPHAYRKEIKMLVGS